MTFTQTIKAELLNNNKNLSPCCKTVFLSCFIRTMGNIEITFKGFGFSLSSENLATLKFAAGIIEKMFGAICSITKEDGARLKTNRYIAFLQTTANTFCLNVACCRLTARVSGKSTTLCRLICLQTNVAKKHLYTQCLLVVVQ